MGTRDSLDVLEKRKSEDVDSAKGLKEGLRLLISG